MEPKRSNHFLAHLPTILLLVLFAMSPWLGILFFILRAIDRDAEKKEQTNVDLARDSRAEDARTAQSAASGQRSETVSDQDIPTAEQKSAKQWHKTLITLCTIFGAIFLLVGIGDLADVMEELFWDHEIDWGELLTALAQTIGGGAALFTGLRMDRARKLERKLDKIVGDRDNIALGELFAAVGIDAVRGRTAVEHAIDHGYFGADAYIDYRTDTLVVRGAAPQPPKAPQPEPEAEPEDPYASLQQQLRRANDAIPDPVMTAKISRLEELSARIFALAKKDPDKKAQLQKFMDYYLPTALKLLNTYAQLSAQDVQGENITDARQSIERSMDLLITAFENQLDKLFQSDALDVSADVAALEGMLNMDGLTGSDFAK